MIYFIQSENTRHIKIGYTHKNVWARLAGLQTGNPSALTVLGVAVGDVAQELSLHNRFRKAWHRGEWFHCVPELLEFIERHTFMPPPASDEDRPFNVKLTRELTDRVKRYCNAKGIVDVHAAIFAMLDAQLAKEGY